MCESEKEDILFFILDFLCAQSNGVDISGGRFKCFSLFWDQQVNNNFKQVLFVIFCIEISYSNFAHWITIFKDAKKHKSLRYKRSFYSMAWNASICPPVSLFVHEKISAERDPIWCGNNLATLQNVTRCPGKSSSVYFNRN